MCYKSIKSVKSVRFVKSVKSKVTGVLRTEFIGCPGSREQSAPQGSTDLMDLYRLLTT